MSEKNYFIIKCPNCKIPFFKYYFTTFQMSFLKWVDGSPKEVFTKGMMVEIKCPKCGMEISVLPLVNKAFFNRSWG